MYVLSDHVEGMEVPSRSPVFANISTSMFCHRHPFFMNNPDPGDDLGDGRAASRLVELGERGFSRALSPQCDGCARGYRGGRSGVPAGSGGGQARF